MKLKLFSYMLKRSAINETLKAFKAMGADKKQLELEKLKLTQDEEYLIEWHKFTRPRKVAK